MLQCNGGRALSRPKRLPQGRSSSLRNHGTSGGQSKAVANRRSLKRQENPHALDQRLRRQIREIAARAFLLRSPRSRPDRRPDRHSFLRRMPFRYSHRARRMGRHHLSLRSGPRNRRPRGESRERREEISEGDLAAVGCLVDSCRTCDNCRGRSRAVLRQTARPSLTTAKTNIPAASLTAVTRRASWSISDFVLRLSEIWISPRPLRSCAPGSRPIRRCANGKWARDKKSAWSAWAVSGIWP